MRIRIHNTACTGGHFFILTKLPYSTGYNTAMPKKNLSLNYGTHIRNMLQHYGYLLKLELQDKKVTYVIFRLELEDLLLAGG
jgi:hypothetical protein